MFSIKPISTHPNQTSELNPPDEKSQSLDSTSSFDRTIQKPNKEEKAPPIKPLQRSDSLISRIFNTPNKIGEKSSSIVIDELIELIKTSNLAIEKVKDKGIILFIGKTGVGKTTTLYFLTGKRLERTTIEKVSQRGTVIKENVIEAVLPITGFTIGHKAKSETSCINTYYDETFDLTFCDAPGSEDTQGPIVDIAQSVGITKAINMTKSVRVIFLLKYSEVINDLKGINIRESIKLISKFIKGFSSNFNSILTIFTHPPEDSNEEENISNLISRLDSVYDETDEKSAEGREIRNFLDYLMNQLEGKTGKVQILNPLNAKPQLFIESIKNLTEITNPQEVFEYSLSEKARLQLKNQIEELKAEIFTFVEKGEYKLVLPLLNNLRFLSTEIDLPSLRDIYKMCIEKIAEDFKSAQTNISKILEERLSDSGNLTDEILGTVNFLLSRIENKENLEQYGHILGKDLPCLSTVKNEIDRIASKLISTLENETNYFLIQSRLKKISKLNEKFNFEHIKQLYEKICDQLSNRMKDLISLIEREIHSFSLTSLSFHLFELKEGINALKDHFDVGFMKSAYQINITNLLSNLQKLTNQISQKLNEEEIQTNEIKEKLNNIKNAITTIELHPHISKEKLQEFFDESIERIIEKAKKVSDDTISQLDKNTEFHGLQKPVNDLYMLTLVNDLVAMKIDPDYFKILEKIKKEVLHAQSIIEFSLEKVGNTPIDYHKLSKQLAVLKNAIWLDKHLESDAFIAKLQEKCAQTFRNYARNLLELLQSHLIDQNISSIKDVQLEFKSLKLLSTDVPEVANIYSRSIEIFNEFVLNHCNKCNQLKIESPFNFEDIHKKIRVFTEIESLDLSESVLPFFHKSKESLQIKIETYFLHCKDETTSNLTPFSSKKKHLDELKQLFYYRSIYTKCEGLYQECLSAIRTQLSYLIEEIDEAHEGSELSTLNEKITLLNEARILDSHLNNYPSQLYSESKRRATELSKEILGILRRALTCGNPDFITIENNLERLKASNNSVDSANYKGYIKVLANHILEQIETISLRIQTLEFSSTQIADLKLSFQVIHKAEKSIFSHLESDHINQIQDQLKETNHILEEKIKALLASINVNLSRYNFSKALNTLNLVNQAAQTLGSDFPKNASLEKQRLEATFYSAIELLPQRVEEELKKVSEDFTSNKLALFPKNFLNSDQMKAPGTVHLKEPIIQSILAPLESSVPKNFDAISNIANFMGRPLDELNQILDGLQSESSLKETREMYLLLKEKITTHLNTLVENCCKQAKSDLTSTPMKKKLSRLSNEVGILSNHITPNFIDIISDLEIEETNIDNLISETFESITDIKLQKFQVILSNLRSTDTQNYQLLCKKLESKITTNLEKIKNYLHTDSIELAGKTYEQITSYQSAIPYFEINTTRIREWIDEKIQTGPNILQISIDSQEFSKLEYFYMQLVTIKKYFPIEWIDTEIKTKIEKNIHEFLQKLMTTLEEDLIELNLQAVAEKLNILQKMASFLSLGLQPYLESFEYLSSPLLSLIKTAYYHNYKEQLISKLNKLPNQIQQLFTEEKFPQIQHIIFKCLEFKYLSNSHIPADILTKLNEEIKEKVNKKYKDLVTSARVQWTSKSYADFEKTCKTLTKIETHLVTPPGIYDTLPKIDLFQNIEESLESFIHPNNPKFEMDDIVSGFINLKNISNIAPSLHPLVLRVMGKKIEQLQQCYGSSYISKIGVQLTEQTETLQSQLGKEIVSEFPQFSSRDIITLNTASAQFGLDYTLQNTIGDDIDKSKLKTQYDTFKTIYDTAVQAYIRPSSNREEMIEYVKNNIRHANGSLANKTSVMKKDLPFILAYIFAYLTIQKSEGFFSINQSDKVIWEPKCTQVLSILRLLGADVAEETTDRLRNHLIQIQTGQGKSITLAVTAIVLALFGYEISCVCYSNLLITRDFNDFKDLFEVFGVSKKIEYVTFAELSEKIINKNGDIRELTVSMFNDRLEEERVPLNPNKKLEKVLLIDEVDLFFSKEFYGKTYNPAGAIYHPDVSNLIKLIWELRNLPKSLEKIQSEITYKSLILQYPDWVNFIDNAINKMLIDVEQYDNPPYHVSNDRIGYKELDEIAYDTVHDYRTMFAYMAEEAKGNITKEAMEAQLRLIFYSGSFSYAEIPYQFDHILGVTGTLPTSKFEKRIMTNRYNIRTTTIAASMYGESKLQFDESKDVLVAESELYQFELIQNKILDVQKTNRAILVFFDSEIKLHRFIESEYGKTLQNISILTERSENKDRFIKQASKSKMVTLLTKGFGRGIDFTCRDDPVIQSGGVHITVTFMPNNLSEEIQLKGRTARQGQTGSFDMILLEDDLFHFEISKNELDKAKKELNLYHFLNTKRNAYFEKEEEKLEEIERATQEFDFLSSEYLRALIEYPKAWYSRDDVKDLFLFVNHIEGIDVEKFFY